MTAFYVAGIAMSLLGAAVVFKVSGWPSELERKSTITRAFRGGVGSTTLILGVMLIFLVRDSPRDLVEQWSLYWAARTFLLCAIPMFVVLTAGSYVQFLIWERNRPKWNRRLHDIVEPSSRAKEGR